MNMTLIPQNYGTPRGRQNRTRFGSGVLAPELKGATGVVDAVFKRLTADRTSQMLFEDFLGFGLLRTGMDLWRGKEYGNDNVNTPAAIERFSRETASILTDNVLAGVIAFRIGKHFFDKTKGSKPAAFSNQFIDYPTLELFQKAIHQMPVDAKHGEAFISSLAKQLGKTPAQQNESQHVLRQAWAHAQEHPETPLKGKKLNELAAALSEKLGQAKEGFSYSVGEHSFKLDSLLEDVSLFSKHMAGIAKTAVKEKSWPELATQSIARTIKAKNVRIPVSLAAAMLATFAVPFAISAISRKLFGIDYYPGEIGLKSKRDQNGQGPQKSFAEKYFPYVTDRLKQGSIWPLLGALSPLPFALGIFNTAKLKHGLPTLEKGLFKPDRFKTWIRMFDFQKLKPFTAQQQMASVFALLISARLLNSRSDNEFRERLVDSFAGWGVWIMGTPLINKAVAKFMDRQNGTHLMNSAGALRTRAEIEAMKHLAPEVLEKTLRSHIWLNAGSTLATVALLGIVEPWIGIKWTQHNEKAKAQKKLGQLPQATQPVMNANPFLETGNIPNVGGQSLNPNTNLYQPRPL